MSQPDRFVEQDQPPRSIWGAVKFYYYKVPFYILGWILFGRNFTPRDIALQMGVQSNPVLSNAWRVATDAHLLILKKRYATALALAALSFEEIGKYLLIQWSKDPTFKYDKSKQHISKQAAIAALFTTEEVRKKYREAKVDFENMSEVEARKLIKAAQEGWKIGKPFETMVVNKVYEHIKWSGLYYDPESAAKGIEPEKITKENAHELMTLAARAFEALADDGNIYIARYSYSMVFEDYEKEVAKQKSEEGKGS